MIRGGHAWVGRLAQFCKSHGTTLARALPDMQGLPAYTAAKKAFLDGESFGIVHGHLESAFEEARPSGR